MTLLSPLLYYGLLTGFSFGLGFLSIKKLSSVFFARATLLQGGLWVIGTAFWPISPMLSLFGVIACLLAQRQFQKAQMFQGKMWLSLSSAFGAILCLTAR